MRYLSHFDNLRRRRRACAVVPVPVHAIVRMVRDREREAARERDNVLVGDATDRESFLFSRWCLVPIVSQMMTKTSDDYRGNHRGTNRVVPAYKVHG